MPPNASVIPIRLRPAPVKKINNGQVQSSFLTEEQANDVTRANLSPRVWTYLASLGIDDPDRDADSAGLIWMHALAIGYSPAYLSENGDGIRQDWPRIPLPAGRDALITSAALGRRVAALLDTEGRVSGVTATPIRPELKGIGGVSRVGGGLLGADPEDLALTVGWGHPGREGVVMPGKGKVVRREYEPAELEAIRQGADALGIDQAKALELLGPTTLDLYLNGLAYWKNVPLKVWDYTIGGYQVIKKWLSYRERDLLGRPLRTEEAREVRDMVRRIAALILLQPSLDANYAAICSQVFPWSRPLETPPNPPSDAEGEPVETIDP